jgi:FkbM family methyltransferase
MSVNAYLIRIKQFFKKIVIFKSILKYRDKKVNYKNLELIKNNFFNRDLKDKIIINIEIQNNFYSLNIRKYPYSDAEIFKQIFIDKCYIHLNEITNVIKKSNNSIKIIDAGANVGFSTLYFMSIYKKFEIVVIEPDISNFEILKNNLNYFNDYYKYSITFLNNALWINNNKLSLNNNFRDFRNASITFDEKTHSDIMIDGITFSNILKLKNWDFIDLFKIDIEGTERFIFANDIDADFILSKIKILVIEIHDEFNIRDKIYSHLQRNNFVYFNHDDLTICINEKI